MRLRHAGMFGLIALALVSLWLLFVGPHHILGLDTGHAGFVLMSMTAWSSLFALYRWPRNELDSVISPGEWRAWIGTLFMAMLTLYMLVVAYASNGASLAESPYSGRVGGNVAMMFIAWIVVFSVLEKRWQGQVQEDERDREINRLAGSWGSGALAACIIGIAVMLGLSPTEKLAWAKPPMIAHMLIFSLLWGSLVQCVVSAIQYWRDRH